MAARAAERRQLSFAAPRKGRASVWPRSTTSPGALARAAATRPISATRRGCGSDEPTANISKLSLSVRLINRPSGVRVTSRPGAAVPVKLFFAAAASSAPSAASAAARLAASGLAASGLAASGLAASVLAASVLALSVLAASPVRASSPARATSASPAPPGWVLAACASFARARPDRRGVTGAKGSAKRLGSSGIATGAPGSPASAISAPCGSRARSFSSKRGARSSGAGSPSGRRRRSVCAGAGSLAPGFPPSVFAVSVLAASAFAWGSGLSLLSTLPSLPPLASLAASSFDFESPFAGAPPASWASRGAAEASNSSFASRRPLRAAVVSASCTGLK